MSLEYSAVVSFDRNTSDVGPALLLRPDENLRTGINTFANSFSDPTSLERDLLVFASTIYACDLAFKRGERENITRCIEVSIPVVNHQAFERIKGLLVEILWVLSHDSWTLNFIRSTGQPEGAQDWPRSKGKTLLFSGGLDSLAGAIDLLDEFGPEGVFFASHITANRVTRESQRSLAAYLEQNYQSDIPRAVLRTGGRKYRDLDFPSDHEREETQRTRSFMFLSVAALAARRSGHHEVVMIAENGQMAIHLPLTAARLGAFSTHTAHPEFVDKASSFFSQLLDFQITITNPYLYKTKSEVVAKLVANHKPAIELSVSCWRGSRLSKDFKHCGECVPCLIRRISLESHGFVLNEYERDLLVENISSLAPDDDGKKNAVELAEFAYVFSTRTEADLLADYPDLISPNIDFEQAIAMYRRFAAEAQRVLSTYPGVVGVLSSISAAPQKTARGSLSPKKPRKASAKKSSRKRR